jgi:hypothetical protein
MQRQHVWFSMQHTAPLSCGPGQHLQLAAPVASAAGIQGSASARGLGGSTWPCSLAAPALHTQAGFKRPDALHHNVFDDAFVVAAALRLLLPAARSLTSTRPSS